MSQHSATGRRRVRPLIVALLAAAVVVGLVVADVVTLTTAKPSFDNETRAFRILIQSTSTTTTVPHRTVPTPPRSPSSLAPPPAPSSPATAAST